MTNGFNLYGMIYDVLTTQIDCGVYRAGDRLPNIEEAEARFLVSPDTLRAAYLQMRRNGYIDLRQKAGATVTRNYSQAETERHIREFFGQRRRALPDIAASTRMLFIDAMCLGLRLATPSRLDEIEAYAASRACGPVESYMQTLKLIFEPLGNELLLRLLWQIYMFEVAPFVSLALSLDYPEADGSIAMLKTVEARRRGDEKTMRAGAEEFHTRFAAALERFYKEKIGEDKGGETTFRWTAYKNTTQLRYSLVPALLAAIGDGVYPIGSILPSPSVLAKANGVSLSTARRTVRLLRGLGAVRMVKRRGAIVLSPEEAASACDFSHPAIQERLHETLQSLHIFAITARSVGTETFASAAAETKDRLLENLMTCDESKKSMYVCLRFLADNAPLLAVREVYAQLLSLLYWGYSLFGLAERQQEPDKGTPPEILDAIERGDGSAFGAELAGALMAALRVCAAAFCQATGIEGIYPT